MVTIGDPDQTALSVQLFVLDTFLFVCVDALHPSQQVFSHARLPCCLPRLNQYLAENKVSCSRAQQSAFGEPQTSNPLNLPLNH